MTRKFRRAVKACVLDGKITTEEKTLLKNLAQEENISNDEAQLFIATQLKKRKVKMERGENWFQKNSGQLLSGIVTLGGIVITALLSGEKKDK